MGRQAHRVLATSLGEAVEHVAVCKLIRSGHMGCPPLNRAVDRQGRASTRWEAQSCMERGGKHIEACTLMAKALCRARKH